MGARHLGSAGRIDRGRPPGVRRLRRPSVPMVLSDRPRPSRPASPVPLERSRDPVGQHGGADPPTGARARAAGGAWAHPPVDRRRPARRRHPPPPHPLELRRAPLPGGRGGRNAAGRRAVHRRQRADDGRPSRDHSPGRRHVLAAVRECRDRRGRTGVSRPRGAGRGARARGPPRADPTGPCRHSGRPHRPRPPDHLAPPDRHRAAPAERLDGRCRDPRSTALRVSVGAAGLDPSPPRHPEPREADRGGNDASSTPT